MTQFKINHLTITNEAAWGKLREILRVTEDCDAIMAWHDASREDEFIAFMEGKNLIIEPKDEGGDK